MSEVRDVEIDEIKTDVDEIQTRLGLLDEERIEILCEKYQEKGTEAFPLPVVFHDEDGVDWLASGHYRLAAIRKALSSDPEAPRVVRVEVREGSKRDAAFFAASANSEHGTQLTWAEMRRLVIRLLRDPQWGEMGDREIARLIGASHTYVSKIHQELDDQDASGNGCQMPPNPKRKVKTKRGGKPFNTTVDKSRRDRDPKAKTTTTPIQPDSSTVPQDEPIADEDEEHIAKDDEAAVTPGDHDKPKAVDDSDGDDDPMPVPPKGFVALITTWFGATAEERQLFLDWATPRRIDEPAGETTPEKHASIYLVERDVLQDMTEAFRK